MLKIILLCFFQVIKVYHLITPKKYALKNFPFYISLSLKGM